MTADLDQLVRWEVSGGTWRVTNRSGDHVSIALETCSGGEVVDVLVSGEAALLAYVGDASRRVDRGDVR